MSFKDFYLVPEDDCGGCCAWMVAEEVGWKLLWLDGGDLGGMKAALS